MNTTDFPKLTEKERMEEIVFILILAIERLLCKQCSQCAC